MSSSSGNDQPVDAWLKVTYRKSESDYKVVNKIVSLNVEDGVGGPIAYISDFELTCDDFGDGLDCVSVVFNKEESSVSVGEICEDPTIVKNRACTFTVTGGAICGDLHAADSKYIPRTYGFELYDSLGCYGRLWPCHSMNWPEYDYGVFEIRVDPDGYRIYTTYNSDIWEPEEQNRPWTKTAFFPELPYFYDEHTWTYDDLEEWAQKYVDNYVNPKSYSLRLYISVYEPTQYPSLELSLVFDCVPEESSSSSSSDNGVDIRTWLYLMPPAPSEWVWWKRTSDGPDLTSIEWDSGYMGWVGIYGNDQEWLFDEPACHDPNAVELTSTSISAYRTPPSHFTPWELEITSLVGRNQDLDPSLVSLSFDPSSGWVLLYRGYNALTKPKGYSWESALSWSREDLVDAGAASDITAFAVRRSAMPDKPVLAAVDEFRWLCDPGQVSADVKSAALRTIYESMARCECGSSGSGSPAGSGSDACPTVSVVRAEVDELVSGRYSVDGLLAHDSDEWQYTLRSEDDLCDHDVLNVRVYVDIPRYRVTASPVLGLYSGYPGGYLLREYTYNGIYDDTASANNKDAEYVYKSYDYMHALAESLGCLKPVYADEDWEFTFEMTASVKFRYSDKWGASDDDYRLSVGGQTESGSYMIFVGSYYTANATMSEDGLSLVMENSDRAFPLPPGDTVATRSSTAHYVVGYVVDFDMLDFMRTWMSMPHTPTITCDAAFDRTDLYAFRTLQTEDGDFTRDNVQVRFDPIAACQLCEVPAVYDPATSDSTLDMRTRALPDKSAQDDDHLIDIL